MKARSISIKVITLFPGFINSYSQFGIIAKAIKSKLLKFAALDLRLSGIGPRQMVDDRPYGGGVGMVLRPDVLLKAITQATKSIRQMSGKKKKSRVILLTPSGKPFTQRDAHRLSKYDELVFVSGRYEGYDERITAFVDEEISIGDYVLMGGELPALVITEAVIRLVPGIIGKIESTHHESFSPSIRKTDGRQKSGYMLEYPQYTKPEEWVVKDGMVKDKKSKKLKVPGVLLTGNHANIDSWRYDESLRRTKKRRPDLLFEQ